MHKTLKMTPAMAAAVSQTLWSMEDLCETMDAVAPKPSKRGRHKKRAAKVSEKPGLQSRLTQDFAGRAKFAPVLGMIRAKVSCPLAERLAVTCVNAWSYNRSGDAGAACAPRRAPHCASERLSPTSIIRVLGLTWLMSF